MKKLLSLALTALLLLSVCAPAFAAPVRLSSADAEAQIALIFSQFDKLKQDESSKPWSYAITDLDHNGRLELLAASVHDSDRSTTLAAWEVDAAGASLLDCTVKLKEDESFPDIVSGNADTFYDAAGDAWYYLFYDNIILSQQEAYAVKCSVSLNKGTLSYEEYAFEHVVTNGDDQSVEFRDVNDRAITMEQYNTAGLDAFAGKERSSTNIDWFSAADVSVARLTDSYGVFVGDRQPEHSSPVRDPQSGVSFMTITKDPTNENHTEGETAWFISGADVWDYLTWTFVAPGGAECSATDFATRFPTCRVGGAGSTALSIVGVTPAMNGYGVYCVFRYRGQTARTSTAWLYVTGTPTPIPTNKMSGSVVSTQIGTISIALDNGTVVQPKWDICEVSGDLDIGCRADVYYRGPTPNTGNVTYVYVYGNEPSFGSMDGYVYDASMNVLTVALDNGDTVSVSQQIVNVVSGELTLGCGCTVYYYGDNPSSDNIYEVDVYGSDPEPVYGSMGGYVYDASMNYLTVALDNGGTVYVSQQLVNVLWGDLTLGCGCTVYYYGDYPTDDNVYAVDVYGSDPEPVIDDDDDIDDPVWEDPTWDSYDDNGPVIDLGWGDDVLETPEF